MLSNQMNSNPIDHLHKDEILELVVEILPELNHKANNILTKISGQALLVQLEKESCRKCKVQNEMLPQLCDQFAKLQDKLLVMTRSMDQHPKLISGNKCLHQSIERFQKRRPNRQVTFDDHLTEGCHLWGNKHRLQNGFYFLLLLLDMYITPNGIIQIDSSNELNGNDKVDQLLTNDNKQWIQVSFTHTAKGQQPSNPLTNFYDPYAPFSLTAALYAAVQSIIKSFNGFFQLRSEQDIQFNIKLPQRQECPVRPKHSGKNQKERVFLDPASHHKNQETLKKNVL